MKMNKKYKIAKKQGLNWQALLIEETQTKLKVLIQRMILKNHSFFDINNEVIKIVEEMIKELESEDLKRNSRPILYSYATRIYNYLKQTYQGLNWLILTSLSAVANKNATTQQIQLVNKFFYDISQKNNYQLNIINFDIDKIPNISNSSYSTAVPLDIYSKNYMQFIKKRIEELVKVQPKEDYTSRVTLRNIAEMQIRQERHDEELQKLINDGINLVWIVPHSNCSERCEQWQGKLYSLDNTYGDIDGINYQPLKNATDIFETTKAGKVYKNGCISGFNCRHTLEPYKRGNKPIEIPSNVINKQRKINNKQRYLERGIREWKERALLYKNIDKKLYQQAKFKANLWNDRYIKYSKNNNVAYYPSRIDII